MLSKKNLFRIKFTVAMCAVAAVALVGYAFYQEERKLIIGRIHQETGAISDTIKQALRHSMMENRRDVTQVLIENLSQLASLELIRIYDREGRIRFSTLPAEIGERGDVSEVESEKATSALISDSGREVFRSVNPIENEPECHRCHSPGEKLLGVLMLDVSTAGTMESIEHFRWATLFLVVSIVLVFGILIFLNQAFDYFRSGP